MKLLALVLVAYTAVMLVIHLSSWKLLEKWNAQGDSWIKRRFSPQAALRVEAVYWLLVLASWPFWPSAAWRSVAVVFAVIHLGAWLVGERSVLRSGGPPAMPLKARRFIVAFDLVEAIALVAIVWTTAAYLSRY